ncbi:ATP-binding protein [Caulobacter rhizosphaerae]
MDRIDLAVDMPAVTAADLALPPPSEGTAEAAARVARARRLQLERAEAIPNAPMGAEALNGRAEGRYLERIADLDEAGRGLLARAAEAGQISARGWTRVLRLARTIADLEGAAGVRRVHVAEALAHRRTSALGAAAGEGVV